MLKETHGRCDSIALTKELLIAVRRLCHRRLALSVTFGDTSPKGRAFGDFRFSLIKLEYRAALGSPFGGAGNAVRH